MNNKLIFASVILMGFAGKAMTTDVKKELLLDIKEETKKCAVEVLNTNTENNEVAGYETTCDTLKILSASEAQVMVDGLWYSVRIQESAESDGGDLDDLFVSNDKGELVAQKLNVASYDNVIRAMAGDSPLKQKLQ